MPASARVCLKLLADQLDLVNRQALETDRLILASARATDIGRRLMAVPGVGPVLASAIVASVPDPHAFKTGRNLAAWIGLVPKQNSSGGRARLGGITKQGNRYLRQLLVIGALAVIRYAERHGTKRPWLVKLMARRTTKIAAVALANKTARMVWAIMTSGEHTGSRCCRPRRDQAPLRRTSLGRATKEGCEPVEPGGGKTHLRHRAPEPVLLVGTQLRGGHHGQRSMRRTNRSKTWPHRPASQQLRDQPCQRGAVQTWRRGRPPPAGSSRRRSSRGFPER